MRALEVREPFGIEALAFTSRPTPVPGPGEVLVRLRALSLNYRDRLVIDGFDRWRPTGARIPVSDGAGIVTALGHGVSRVKEGERVTPVFYPRWRDGPPTPVTLEQPLGGAAADGLFADYAVVHEDSVVTLPPHLTFEQAATLPCAALTAWHGVAGRTRPRDSDTVVVLGTGGVALFALQFARAFGAQVIVTSSSDEKLARTHALGAFAGINYRRTPDWSRRVREITNGVGADLVVDTAGALSAAIDAVRVGGTIAFIGLIGRTRADVDLVALMGKSATIHAIDVGSREMFESMNRFIASAALTPVIDRVFAFDEAREAFRYLSSGAHFGKICIRLSTEEDTP
jgi:NADPH:quinone reductase-like Zn-dependent oxidoreductase